MSIRTVYTNGIFDAFDGDRQLVNQPFKPTDTGSQDPWTSEEEALAWWATQSPNYTTTEEE